MYVLFQSLPIQLLGCLYLAWRGGQLLPRGVLRYTFRGLLVAQLLYLVCIVLLHNLISEEILSWTIVITGSWFIALLYILPVTLLVNGIRRLYERWQGRCLGDILGKRTYALCKGGSFVFGVLLVTWLLVYGYRTASTPRVVHKHVELTKPLGGGRRSLRILFVSDLHLGETIRRPFVERLVKIYKEMTPDVVLVGGDIFDYSSEFAYRDGIPELMSEIAPPLGSYYVMGNHDYRSNVERKKEWIARVGGCLMIDSLAIPGGAFLLIGRDDYTQRDHRATLRDLTSHIPLEARCLPRIVLDHQPFHLEELSQEGIDLALFGHTHDGQIFPFSLLVRAYYELAHGFMKKGDTSIYVSSGYGAAGPAIRLFTDSEVVILDMDSPSK